MFTGIVEGKGSLRSIDLLKAGFRFHIESFFNSKQPLTCGESISVSGACLTIVASYANVFEVEISSETLEKTFFRSSVVDDIFNLERALKADARIQGHWVTGHIDGLGQIKNIKEAGEFLEMTVEIASSLGQDMVKKGPTAIDGVSLTINEMSQNVIQLMLIPETLKRTTLGEKKIGDTVHVELDLIGKYVKNWMNQYGKY